MPATGLDSKKKKKLSNLMILVFFSKGRLVPDEESEPQAGINQSVAMAIAGTSMFGIKVTPPDRVKLFHQVRI